MEKRRLTSLRSVLLQYLVRTALACLLVAVGWLLVLMLWVQNGGLFLPALEPYPYMMTPCQIAEFTGLTSQGVRKLLAAGEMRGVKFGSKWLVPKLCLLRYLNRREDGGENDEDAQMRQARGSR